MNVSDSEFAKTVLRDMIKALQKAHRRIAKSVVVWQWVPICENKQVVGLCLRTYDGTCTKAYVRTSSLDPGGYLWSTYFSTRQMAKTPQDAMRQCVKMLRKADEYAFRRGDMIVVSSRAEKWLADQKKKVQKI